MLYSLLQRDFTGNSCAVIWADFACLPAHCATSIDPNCVRVIGAAMAAAHRHIVIAEPSCAVLHDRRCLLQAAIALHSNSAAVRRVHQEGTGSKLPRRVRRTVSISSSVNSLEVRTRFGSVVLGNERTSFQSCKHSCGVHACVFAVIAAPLHAV